MCLFSYCTAKSRFLIGFFAWLLVLLLSQSVTYAGETNSARHDRPAQHEIPTKVSQLDLSERGLERPSPGATEAVAEQQDAKFNLGQLQHKRLKVSIKIVPPFVIDSVNHYSGFSIDVWQQLAQRLNLQYDLVAHRSINDQIAAVKKGEVDLAISAIDMTEGRERDLDFTHAYYDSGLQILVRPHKPHSLLELLDPTNLPIIQILQIGLLLSFLQANIIYFAERRTNPTFQKGYLHGLWEGFWWMSMIIATGEYGEKDTPHPLKRLVTITFWLLGVVFIAAFTATVTSNLTLKDINGAIKGPEDLIGKRVITVAESAAAQYLTNHKIPFKAIDHVQAGMPIMKDNDADAFVFDAPVLQYFAAREGRGVVAVEGPVFAHAPIGVALPKNSPLRKPLDVLILQFFQDGTLDEINDKWFKTGSGQ